MHLLEWFPADIEGSGFILQVTYTAYYTKHIPAPVQNT